MKITLTTTLSIFVLIICSCSNASAETEADWLLTLQTYQDLIVIDKAIKDFTEYKDINGGKVEYEPTGQIFRNYQEIKAAIPSLKLKKAELMIKYTKSMG